MSDLKSIRVLPAPKGDCAKFSRSLVFYLKPSRIAHKLNGQSVMKYLILAVSGLLWTAPAHADWLYVKWGMTQQQLSAASNGAVRAISKHDYSYGEAIANTTFSDGALTFDVQFSGPDSAKTMFGLPIQVDNIRFGIEANCDRILPYLRSKYAFIGMKSANDFRFSDGGDEIRYYPFSSTCSFRRFKRGDY